MTESTGRENGGPRPRVIKGRQMQGRKMKEQRTSNSHGYSFSVPRFPVLYFPVLTFGHAHSSPAISGRAFSVPHFPVLHIPVLHFQCPRNNLMAQTGWELPNLKWGSESPQPMTRHNSIAFQNRISDCRADETASFSHHYQYFLSFGIN